MRYLTIKRAKRFVACLAKMKVYIEDHERADINIGGVPCRRLGELKNGEEATYMVTSGAAKVFVIADTLSKNFCNEYYQLEEGEEDVVLTGRNEFNPASGNAFRFDNNNSEGAVANRKRGTRIGVIVLIVAAAIGFVIGIIIGLNTFPETFSAEGMSITVTDEFIETDVQGYTLVLGSPDVAIFAIKEEFNLFDSEYSLDEYAELVIDANEFDVTLKSVDGLLYFEREFTNTEENVTYRYYSFVYEGKDAFWFIQFAVEVEKAPEYVEDIFEWARSVEFS